MKRNNVGMFVPRNVVKNEYDICRIAVALILIIFKGTSNNLL